MPAQEIWHAHAAVLALRLSTGRDELRLVRFVREKVRKVGEGPELLEGKIEPPAPHEITAATQRGPTKELPRFGLAKSFPSMAYGVLSLHGCAEP